MAHKIVVGLDGHSSSSKALDYAQNMAKLVGACELLVVYVIEWSPFSFQTAEENAERHKRREEEITTATDRVVTPALAQLADAGLSATGIVRHGNVADTLDAIAKEHKADQIVVGRSAQGGMTTRIFGSSTANLVMNASVPVTVIA